MTFDLLFHWISSTFPRLAPCQWGVPADSIVHKIAVIIHVWEGDANKGARGDSGQSYQVWSRSACKIMAEKKLVEHPSNYSKICILICQLLKAKAQMKLELCTNAKVYLNKWLIIFEYSCSIDSICAGDKFPTFWK